MKAFTSGTGMSEEDDKEIVDFRSLFDGPRNKSRRRYRQKNKNRIINY